MVASVPALVAPLPILELDQDAERRGIGVFNAVHAEIDAALDHGVTAAQVGEREAGARLLRQDPGVPEGLTVEGVAEVLVDRDPLRTDRGSLTVLEEDERLGVEEGQGRGQVVGTHAPSGRTPATSLSP